MSKYSERLKQKASRFLNAARTTQGINTLKKVNVDFNSEFRLYVVQGDEGPMHVHIDTLDTVPSKSTRLLIVRDNDGTCSCVPYAYYHSPEFEYEMNVPPAPLERKERFDIVGKKLQRAMDFANERIGDCITTWNRTNTPLEPINKDAAQAYVVMPYDPLFPEETHLELLNSEREWRRQIEDEKRILDRPIITGK